MSNLLNNIVIYLAGPMEHVPDNGTLWRTYFRQKAQQLGLTIKFLDPTDKPIHRGSQHIKEDKDYVNTLKEAGEWNKLQDLMKEVRHHDLRYVDLSDAVVVLVDKNVHMCGTYNEIFEAEDQRKPLLVICREGLKGIPGWLLACINLDLVFNDENECLEYLVDLNQGNKPLADDWVIISNIRQGVTNG